MNSPLDYIVKSPKENKRLLGIEHEQLQQLIAQAELRHNQKQEEIEKNKIRIIKKGGGRKPQLSVTEQILLTLVYLRHSPSFQLLGWQFGVSESTAQVIFHYWQEIFREILPPSLLEQVKKYRSDREWGAKNSVRNGLALLLKNTSLGIIQKFSPVAWSEPCNMHNSFTTQNGSTGFVLIGFGFKLCKK